MASASFFRRVVVAPLAWVGGVVGAPIALENWLEAELSEDFFWSYGLNFPVVGDAFTLRCRYAPAGVAQDLTGALVVWRLKNKDGGQLERRSDVDIAGVSPATREIGIDSGQGSPEVVDADGNPVSGRGWFELRMRTSAQEVAAFKDFLGAQDFEVVIKLGTADVTWAKGRFEVLSGLGVRPVA